LFISINLSLYIIIDSDGCLYSIIYDSVIVWLFRDYP